jgi:hypothetical protein
MESTISETGTPPFTRSVYPRNWIYVLVAFIVLLVSFFKIADLDFWWHLKTGEIIWEQKRFQHTEIYSFTAPGRPYVDHEWLFQVIQYFLYSAGGPLTVILAKCAILISIYLLITRFLFRKGINPWIILTLIIVSIAGGRTRFVERPEIFTELFLVCCYLWIEKYLETKDWKHLLPILPVIVLWSNIHAAVILGLILMATFAGGLMVHQILERSGYPSVIEAGRREILVLSILFVVCTLLTGINPTGYQVLIVPFELTGIIESGLLNNQEWQQPPAWRLPFFYLCICILFLVFLANARRLHVPHFLFGTFLAYISLKYVRNIALFSMFMPLLIWPYLRSVQVRWKPAMAAICAIGLYWLFTQSPFEFGHGIARYFPDQIVKYTKEKELRGNMLNSYAFGGYLIWSVYPERKIFIDGRNEVFLPLLEEIVRVRADSRLWTKFLEKYQIEYALLAYWDELEEVTMFDAQNRPIQTYAPFSSTHFPRSRWALIYWDDDGMILVKRDGLNSSLAAREYRSVFPEGTMYQQNLIRGGKLNKQQTTAELFRKLKEDPGCKRARMLLDQLNGL